MAHASIASGAVRPASPTSTPHCATVRSTTSSRLPIFCGPSRVRALPAALLARRPFQAGALRGEVGELRRLLDRKRGGATFRQL
ncbi:hypothetical protein GS575_27990 [Rhodococcus hoagii]|nr:hypothetical protein [Prescottella equi]